METTLSKVNSVSIITVQSTELLRFLMFWGASLCFGLTETTCSTYPVGVEEKSRWSNLLKLSQ